ncbi:MAG: hypothetical protein JW849_06485 [Phycisphaerae bacterium]|nr:hypothetical protein [Phycisphaerae bacterium]
MEIAEIYPIALLILQGILSLTDHKPDYVILNQRTSHDIIRLGEKTILNWYTTEDERQLLFLLRMDLLNLPVEAENVSSIIVGKLKDISEEILSSELEIMKSEFTDESIVQHVLENDNIIKLGKPVSATNLRIGKLTIKNPWNKSVTSLRVATVLMAVLALTLLSLFIHRGINYKNLALNFERSQLEIYQKLYPNSKKAPSNIVARMESEMRKMYGVIGQGRDVPRISNAMDALHAVVTNLPQNIKWRILKLQIHPGSIDIIGQVKTHSDAETIVQSLTKGSLDVSAPTTELLSTGEIYFKISANPVQENDTLAVKGGKQ